LRVAFARDTYEFLSIHSIPSCEPLGLPCPRT
jgi:hypothetical protein